MLPSSTFSFITTGLHGSLSSRVRLALGRFIKIAHYKRFFLSEVRFSHFFVALPSRVNLADSFRHFMPKAST